MHFRRLAALFLGLWIAGGLFMVWVATENFKAVDRLLEKPSQPAAEGIQKLGGPGEARMFLRHHSAELNRHYFERWETVQIGLGVILCVILLLAASSRDRVGLVFGILMLALVACQKLLITPHIIDLGRAIDFIPASAASPQRTQFGTYHMDYAILEIMKWAAGLVVVFKLLVRSDRHRAR